MNNNEQKQFFRDCLYTALIELMTKKPISKIGIGELCSRAGVSRMTYYRNYRSKEEILARHLEDCYDSFIHRLRAEDELSLDRICLLYFTFMKEEERFFTAIVHSRLVNIFIEEFGKYMGDVMQIFLPAVKPPYYIMSYISGGFAKMSIDWIYNGMDVPVEEMATLLSAFTSYMNSQAK